MRRNANRPPVLIVFTDLDGTLLDHDSYSFAAAGPALEHLRRFSLPLILNSSKTVPEQLQLRQALDNRHPFLAENGHVLAVPRGYFSAPAAIADELDVQATGVPYARLREILCTLRTRHGFRFRGFGDLSEQEVAAACGLPVTEAALARQRTGTEPLLWEDSDAALETFRGEVEKQGLQLTRGGRFVHVSGPGDKASALPGLLERYRALWPDREIVSAGLGDSANDLPMLAAVDYPVVIPRRHGAPLQVPERPDARRAPEAGPRGWNLAMLSLLQELGFD